MDDQVYEKAISLLSLRLHTTGELHQKLRRYRYSDAAIREVLLRLESLDFLNDQRYAEIFVDNLKRFKDWGHFGIKTKLMQRKIPTEIIENALQSFFTSEDELGVARRLVLKLKKRKNQSYEKLTRALSSRGFRSQIIQEILRRT